MSNATTFVDLPVVSSFSLGTGLWLNFRFPKDNSRPACSRQVTEIGGGLSHTRQYRRSKETTIQLTRYAPGIRGNAVNYLPLPVISPAARPCFPWPLSCPLLRVYLFGVFGQLANMPEMFGHSAIILFRVSKSAGIDHVSADCPKEINHLE